MFPRQRTWDTAYRSVDGGDGGTGRVVHLGAGWAEIYATPGHVLEQTCHGLAGPTHALRLALRLPVWRSGTPKVQCVGQEPVRHCDLQQTATQHPGCTKQHVSPPWGTARTRLSRCCSCRPQC